MAPAGPQLVRRPAAADAARALPRSALPVAPSVEQPPAQTEPVAWPTPYGTRSPAPRLARPPAVVWACVLTCVFCGIVVAALGVTVLVMLASPDALFEELHRQNPDLADQGLTDGEIRTASLITAGVILPWCLAASGFAIQAFRRVRWGRRALLISAAVAGAVSLVGLFASPIMALPLIACVATVAPPPGPRCGPGTRRRRQRREVDWPSGVSGGGRLGPVRWRATAGVGHPEPEDGPQHAGRCGCDQRQTEIRLEQDRIVPSGEPSKLGTSTRMTHAATKRGEQGEPQAEQAEMPDLARIPAR